MDSRYDIKADKLKLSPSSHIHFIGIGGSSMSGIAEIALHRGYKISGSDRSLSASTQKLQKLGAVVYEGHNSNNLSLDCDLVVYTLAISDDNPEFLKAVENNIPVIERGTFLGVIAKEYSCTIAVSGTHGKTTTTSMLASVTMAGNMDPNIHVGGIVRTLGSNVRTGHGDLFVTEACEYHENFLHLSPDICIILNIEAEHLDYYKDFDDIKSAFIKLAKKVSKDGYLVLCADDSATLSIANSAECNIITYGTKPLEKAVINALGKQSIAHYNVENISSKKSSDGFTNANHYNFDITKNNKLLTNVTLNVPGNHNILNALATAAAADTIGCPTAGIANGLQSFCGAGRRFEIVGSVNGATIIDDYAHHPTEIKATLDSAKQSAIGKIWSVLQPHTYSRAIAFQNEFCKALEGSDHVIVTDIYAAREPFTDKINSKMLAEQFTSKGLSSIYIADFGEISAYLKENVSQGDMILLLGAGTVNQIAGLLKE